MKDNLEMLHTEDLCRSFQMQGTKIDVLKGINLTVYQQEFIAVMGKSGSGKTTLLKLLSILDRPSSGKVYFKGTNTRNIRGDRLAEVRRREIGFIYQDYYLMDSLSVLENIMLPSILDRRGAEKCLDESGRLAELMGISSLLEKHTYELSGGEKQRVAICRALSNHPDLIFADEPTGNLDSSSSETVMNYLFEINQKLKKTIVMVTHDPYVASCSSRVIFLKDGMIGRELKHSGDRNAFCEQIVEEEKRMLR